MEVDEHLNENILTFLNFHFPCSICNSEIHFSHLSIIHVPLFKLIFSRIHLQNFIFVKIPPCIWLKYLNTSKLMSIQNMCTSDSLILKYLDTSKFSATQNICTSDSLMLKYLNTSKFMSTQNMRT